MLILQALVVEQKTGIEIVGNLHITLRFIFEENFDMNFLFFNFRLDSYLILYRDLILFEI